MEPEFLALNFPRFTPEGEIVADEKAEESNATDEQAQPWYSSLGWFWNWCFPVSAEKSAAVTAQGAAPAQDTVSGAQADPSPSDIPAIVAAAVTAGIGKKKKTKAKPAESATPAPVAAPPAPAASK